MTSKQFYAMLLIFTISLKVQKLPCIIYGEVKKDGWITFLAYLIINVIGIILAFYILKKTKNLSIEQRCSTALGEAFKRILLFVVSIYFLMQTLLFYESMQNLFEHTLFENLSWRLFSLLLLVCVLYLASTGLKNIALNFELYLVIIIFSYVILSIMGSTTTNFSEIFPFETIRFDKIISSFKDFNLWFGDFFLILFIGKGAKNIKLGWTILTYVSAMLFVIFINIVFVGIYLEYCPIQSSLISMIAEQSMLGLNIGRVDWFLILIAEIGTILSCAVSFYLSGKCMHGVFPRAKFIYVLIALSVVLYCFDVAYLVDTHTRQFAIFNTLSIVSLVIKVVVTVVLMFLSIWIASKENKKSKSGRKENELGKHVENNKAGANVSSKIMAKQGEKEL